MWPPFWAVKRSRLPVASPLCDYVHCERINERKNQTAFKPFTICRSHSFPSEFTLFGVYAAVIQTMTIHNVKSPLMPGHGHAAYATLGMFGNWNGVFVKELHRHTFGKNSALKSFDGSWLKAVCWASRNIAKPTLVGKKCQCSAGVAIYRKDIQQN